MTWNYRIFKVPAHTGAEDHYAIHEVYYDADGNPKMRTEDNVGPSGDSMEELRSDMRMIMQAFLKPELTDLDFPFPREITGG